MNEKMNFLIVGGTSGIGASLADHLVNQGGLVTVVGRTSVARPNIASLVMDVTKDELDISLLPTTLHGLAYCPGSIQLKPFARLTAADFLQDLQINLLSAIPIIQRTLPLLKNAETASIVLFSTVAVRQGMPFHASVAAAKGAIEGLSLSLAAEFAPRIRVNTIAPSLTSTPLSVNLLNSEAKIKNASERHPLKRIGNPNDIASLAAFLLSNESSWITGQVFPVDGGLSGLRLA